MSEDATLDEFIQKEDSDESSEKEGEWVRRSISQISHWTDAGGTPRTSNEDYWDGDIPWVQTGELTKRHIQDTEKQITELGLEESSTKRFPPGTLLIGMYGEPTVGESALLEIEATTNQACCGVFPDTDKVNAEFLHQMMQYEKPRLYSLRVGSGQQNIRQGIIRKFEIDIPPLPEQRKIATVLYTVDRAIETTEEIEAQLRRVKKGATQKLFTYGLNDEDTRSHHIGDFPRSWEFDKVSNLAEIERGNTPRTSHDEYYGGEITWVTPDDLSDLNEGGNGKYISDSGRKLTPKGVESSSLTVVEPDSVMFTSRSYGIGRTAICTVPAATNQGITAFECGESLDTEFFYYYFNYIMDYVVSISGGSTFPEISKSATGNIDVPVPRIEEQKEIASILSQFDEQILQNREVSTQLKRLKRGLMQDLLSGTVRTTDTNIEVPDEIVQYG